MASALAEAASGIGHCRQCRMFTENELCNICSADGRDASLLCAVESPADVMAIEDATGYRGQYFVLMGHLSPLDGIGPSELGLAALEDRLGSGDVSERIIATNPTVEGEATALYLCRLLKPLGFSVSRVAQGLPAGSTLEHVDELTMARALSGRRPAS